MTMIAYHGNHGLKARTMAKVRRHRRLDQLVQGIGAQGAGAEFRGCAVGCTIGTYDHAAYEARLGVPEVLARLEDQIFEALPREKALAWPERFLGAIRPGADLSLVWSRFALWLLEVELAAYPTSAPVAALYRRRLAGDEPTRSEWAAAWDAAWDSARASRASRASRAAEAAAWDRFADKLIELLLAAPGAQKKRRGRRCDRRPC